MENKFEDLSFKELLGYSIRGEEAANEAYMALSERVSGLPSDRFKSLAQDESRHKEALLELHEEEFGGRDYIVPKNKELPPHEGELIDIDSDDIKALIQAVEAAIEAEKNAYRIYKHLARDNEKHSDLFDYIAMMEKGHMESLKEEKKSVLGKKIDKRKGKTSIDELDLWSS